MSTECVTGAIRPQRVNIGSGIAQFKPGARLKLTGSVECPLTASRTAPSGSLVSGDTWSIPTVNGPGRGLPLQFALVVVVADVVGQPVLLNGGGLRPEFLLEQRR